MWGEKYTSLMTLSADCDVICELYSTKICHNSTIATKKCSCSFCFHGSTALVGLRLLIVEVLDTSRLVGIVWTRDQPVAETST
jgi:hypothetical protein